jgi:hypothetical protein
MIDAFVHTIEIGIRDQPRNLVFDRLALLKNKGLFYNQLVGDFIV